MKAVQIAAPQKMAVVEIEKPETEGWGNIGKD